MINKNIYRTTKTIFHYTVLLVVFFLTYACSNHHGNKELPNILWLVSEDNSPYLGCYGDDFADTPNLDALASKGVIYTNAFANTPVCAPARFTLITGCYASSAGTQHMRSRYPIPDDIKFFPQYLREKGYYCTNNAKEDYNTIKPEEVWDESSNKASYLNRNEGQPFFHVQNFGVSHESSLHKKLDSLTHNPEEVTLPPYHPDTPEIRYDWAQYYDKITELDKQIGEFLKKLEDEGLAENTIVMYYGDHGGVLARSKRYVYETGTRVPLIIHFPKKYKHLASGKPNTEIDRLVNFVDFAPTMLSLTGSKTPDHMQGRAFLGKQKTEDPSYVFMYRGRMDERYDMSRAIRDKQYRYIRNYMPYRIYGQHLEYLWRAPSVPSWEQAYLKGECDKIQSKFWEKKPIEELYEVDTDPWEVNNLASDPTYEKILRKFRAASDSILLKTFDSGFLPEAEWSTRFSGSTGYSYVRTEDYPIQLLIEISNLALECNLENLPALEEYLKSPDSAVRYWAATGLLLLKEKTNQVIPVLKTALKDESGNIRIIAAEGLYDTEYKDLSIEILKEELDSENELIRVYALNVIDCLDIGPEVFEDEVLALLKGKNPEDNTYYLRSSRELLKKWESE